MLRRIKGAVPGTHPSSNTSVEDTSNVTGGIVGNTAGEDYGSSPQMGEQRSDERTTAAAIILQPHTHTTTSSNPSPTTSNHALSFSDHETKLTLFVVKAAAVASLGGILFGYDLGVVSGALPQVKAAFDLAENEQESVVSFLYLGAGLGAAVGGYLCDAKGRRWSILLADVIFMAGAGLLYLASSFSMLLLGRFVMGFGVSLSGCADVAYLTELSPRCWRGAIVSRNEACISFGFLMAYIVGYGLNQVDPNDGWRLMFGLSGVMALVQFFGMLALPESPVWLTMQGGREDEVKNAIRQIYELTSDEQVCSFHDNEFQDIIAADGLRSSHSHSYTMPSPKESIIQGEVISAIDNVDPARKAPTSLLRQYYRQTIIAAFLSIIQQFCGHTNVLNFAPEIFASAGLEANASLASTILLGCVKFMVTILVIWKIDRIGRRALLLGGMSLIAIALFCMSIAFYDPNAIYTGLAVVGAVLMSIGYAASFGPLTWLLTSEMFPSKIRGRALGSSTVLTYLCASLVSYSFLSVQSRYESLAIPFMVYFVITTTSIIFAIVAIPDTGFQSPMEIHASIKQMLFWRRRPLHQAVSQEEANSTGKKELKLPMLV
jgi:MFS family permease